VPYLLPMFSGQLANQPPHVISSRHENTGLDSSKFYGSALPLGISKCKDNKKTDDI